jgi:hypothetical protein
LQKWGNKAPPFAKGRQRGISEKGEEKERGAEAPLGHLKIMENLDNFT